MAAAIGWGALAASSLVIGALLSFARRWSPRQVGLVLAFGAGALISAVSFELAQEGLQVGSAGATGIGLGIGAIVYFLLDGLIAKCFSAGRGRRGRAQGSSGGTALALGAFLDGIPEQAVLGISLAAGQGVGVALLLAIFVSNLPEAMGSADEMRKAGRSRRGDPAPLARRRHDLHAGDGRRLRGRRRGQWQPACCDRRLCRRRPLSDADRLDDPRRPQRRRPHRRPSHRPRLRPRRRPLLNYLRTTNERSTDATLWRGVGYPSYERRPIFAPLGQREMPA